MRYAPDTSLLSGRRPFRGGGRDRASVPRVPKSPLSAQRLSAVPQIDVWRSSPVLPHTQVTESGGEYAFRQGHRTGIVAATAVPPGRFRGSGSATGRFRGNDSAGETGASLLRAPTHRGWTSFGRTAQRPGRFVATEAPSTRRGRHRGNGGALVASCWPHTPEGGRAVALSHPSQPSSFWQAPEGEGRHDRAVPRFPRVGHP